MASNKQVKMLLLKKQANKNECNLKKKKKTLRRDNLNELPLKQINNAQIRKASFSPGTQTTINKRAISAKWFTKTKRRIITKKPEETAQKPKKTHKM